MNIGCLARWYRWIEYAAFGRALERRRFALLPRLKFTQHVLVLGEGDGRTVERLLVEAPMAHVNVVELGPEMIALAKRRVSGSGRVEFHCGDALTTAWPASHYDAVVTNFFLDCFEESEARDLIRRIVQALKPNGRWLIAEFAIPPSGWRRVHGQIWIVTMYRFFGITTALRARKLPPIEALMREAGLQCIEREEARAGLMVSELWAKSAATRL